MFKIKQTVKIYIDKLHCWTDSYIKTAHENTSITNWFRVYGNQNLSYIISSGLLPKDLSSSEILALS